MFYKHAFLVFFIFVEKIDLKNGDVEVMPLGKKKAINFYYFNFSYTIISLCVSDIKLHL